MLTIDKLQDFQKTKQLLDEVCEKYSKVFAHNYRKYIGWQISDILPNCIHLNYEWFDWKGEYCCDKEVIPFEQVINFYERLNNEK